MGEIHEGAGLRQSAKQLLRFADAFKLKPKQSLKRYGLCKQCHAHYNPGRHREWIFYEA